MRFSRELCFLVVYTLLTVLYIAIGSKYVKVKKQKGTRKMLLNLIVICFISGAVALLGGVGFKLFLLLDLNHHFE